MREDFVFVAESLILIDLVVERQSIYVALQSSLLTPVLEQATFCCSLSNTSDPDQACAIMKIFFLCLFVAAVLGHGENFRAIDLNCDGVVVYQEMLSDFLQKDTNGDGLVSREEFAAKSFVGSIPFFVECTFNYYDKMDGKKDGIMEEISTKTTYSILDPDNDGEITYEDFAINVPQIENGIKAEMMALLEQGSY
ncbi:uncharacterized protein LOC112568735 isoform X1 [Pomacea canaliculata]|uniref:uncharacterized protein LOC112568735 isoform X1 n=1 Tax=Pomacea canaliculata TaxID=400727 RepID=UPI000D73711B|nr:uncharacterized protein LOC112568735 isoform X1 [Pomacea canaliculata]